VGRVRRSFQGPKNGRYFDADLAHPDIKKLLDAVKYGRAPEWKVLGMEPGDWKELPLHLKGVKVCNPFKLIDMAVTPEKRENLRKSLPWLNFQYTKVPDNVVLEETKLSAQDVRSMLNERQVEVVTQGMAIRGTVKLFAIPEFMKQRRRAIKNTFQINEMYGKETLRKLELITRKNLLGAVHWGKYTATVDMSAWYDQLELGETAREYMCFTKDGVTYRLTRLPMGQRHAVEIAQAVSEALIDFDMGNVRAQAYIDNLRFVSDDRLALEKALVTLQKRCEETQITMNEDLSQPSKLIKTEGEFLGLMFDHKGKTVKIGGKTLEKLKCTAAAIDNWTYRQYLGHMGLLFYASAPLRLNLADKFYAIKYYREVSAKIQAEPYLLDAPINLRPSCLGQLINWTKQVQTNTPAKVPDATEKATHILITDASRWGWGAVYLDVTNGKVQTKSEAWEREFKGKRVSTWAEPEAIARAACHFIDPKIRGRTIVLTDSSTAVGAYEKGYSPAFAVNKAVEKLKSMFTVMEFECFHLKGFMNVADPYSRNESAEEPSVAIITDLALGAQKSPPRPDSCNDI
jgi:hypothetical protein